MDYRKQCVTDYLNGEDIKKLVNKYSVVESTIYRWIKNANLNEFQIITAKIAKVIPINIQNEILQTLSATPLRQGYDEIKWNKEILINYIKNKYNIEIDIKIAELLFEKKRMISKDKEEEFDNIVFDLEQYGYNVVFIDKFIYVKEELYNQYLKCAYEENISLSQAILDYSYSIKKQRIDGVRDLNLIINECLRNYLDISKGEVPSEEAINRLKRYKDKYIKVINSKYI